MSNDLDLFANAGDERPAWLTNPRVLRWETAAFGDVEVLKAIVACPDRPSGETALTEAVATAQVAGYSKPHDALARIIGRQKATISIQSSGRYSRGNPDRLFLTREGVNRLVLDSTKPEAGRLKDWLAEDVLTSIEDTGSYTASLSLTEVDLLDQLEAEVQRTMRAIAGWRQEKQRAELAEARNAELEDAAEAYRHFIEKDGTVKWANACDHLGVRRNLFGAHLRSRKITYTHEYFVTRNDVEVKRQGERHNRPYADYRHWFAFPAYEPADPEKLDGVPEHRQYDRRVTKDGMDGLRRELKRHVIGCGNCTMCSSVRLAKPKVYAEWRSPSPAKGEAS